MLFTFFFQRWFSQSAEKSAQPKGYYFLRNFKAKNRDRVVRAIQSGGLQENIIVRDKFSPSMSSAEAKISVYCDRQKPEAESLFFQYYSIVKAEERLTDRSSPVLQK